MRKDKVAVTITNSPHGLHEGHKALIEYAKKFGEVSVQPLEAPYDRGEYFRTGVSKPPYKVDLDNMRKGCADTKVELRRPKYILVSEEKRIATYNQVSRFVNSYRDVLGNNPYYINSGIYSIMAARLTPYDWFPSTVVHGPEVLSFFYRHVAKLFGWANHEIMPEVKRDESLVKYSTSALEGLPFDPRRVRHAVLGARQFYKVGDNSKLLEELKNQYKHRLWKWADIRVWEGGIVPGRLEVSTFIYPGSNGWAHKYEEVDYFA